MDEQDSGSAPFSSAQNKKSATPFSTAQNVASSPASRRTTRLDARTWPPFERPDPEKFRPELMAHWTLPMVLAWIVYRDLDEVREWHAPYRAECLRWVYRKWTDWHDGSFTRDGCLSGPRRQRSCGSEKSCCSEPAWQRATDPRHPCRGREAEEQLWGLLQEGTLEASGIDTTTGRHVDIPALDWHELEPVLQDAQSYPGKGTRFFGGGRLSAGYREVLVLSAPVRQLLLARVEKPVLTETRAETPTPEEQPKITRGHRRSRPRNSVGPYRRRSLLPRLGKGPPENSSTLQKRSLSGAKRVREGQCAGHLITCGSHRPTWLAGVKPGGKLS